MKQVKLVAVLICLFLLTSVFTSYADFMHRGDSFSRPGPDLFYPLTDNIDLSGKQYLDFKWRAIDEPYTNHYEVRIYKGYQMNTSTLMFKLQVKLSEYPLRVAVSNFDAGCAYSWSLAQVFFDGRKSDKSYGSFTVIKK